MNKPKWLLDIESYVDSIPYGSVSIPDIQRAQNQVVSITTIGSETLRYNREGKEGEDNAAAVKDILGFLTSLIDDGHTGIVDFGVDMKDGKISLLTIRNTKKSQY